MWIWILIGFVVVGAILGGLSDKDGNGEGCLLGAFSGLLEGGSCLIQLLILLALVAFAAWIFG